MAAGRRHAAGAEQLLAHGADTCHKTLGGMTPHGMAMAAGMPANAGLAAVVGAHWQCAAPHATTGATRLLALVPIHISRCRRSTLSRSRGTTYHYKHK